MMWGPHSTRRVPTRHLPSETYWINSSQALGFQNVPLLQTGVKDKLPHRVPSLTFTMTSPLSDRD